jgi:DNA polymerase-3 subunit gamma/tau
MATLTRAWNFLLKGLRETLDAPSPLRAAEMVLIRLCYAADLPSPSDALKALQNGAAAAPAAGAASPAGATPGPSPRGGGNGGGARLAVQPATAALAQPVAATAPPNPRSFTEIVALFEARREARLVHHLMHHVHEVRCEPGLIEFRPEPKAPVDRAARLSDLLGQWTGRRWIASVSSDAGKPTLVEQKAVQGDQLRSRAEADPLVQAILKTFPGAKLDTVRRKGEQTSLVAGLVPAADEPPAMDDYPADDDIPESEF